jgi:hypothetical protein
MSVYNNFKELLLYRVFNGATVKMILLQNGYSFNGDTHDEYSDVSASEIANGNGYTTGGKTLAGLSISQDDTDNEGVLDCNDPVWTSASITAYGCIVYIDSETTPVADALVNHQDFSGAVSSTNGNFTVEIASEGLINAT